MGTESNGIHQNFSGCKILENNDTEFLNFPLFKQKSHQFVPKELIGSRAWRRNTLNFFHLSWSFRVWKSIWSTFSTYTLYSLSVSLLSCSFHILHSNLPIQPFNGPFPVSVSIFLSWQFNLKWAKLFLWRWLDLNRGPLMSKGRHACNCANTILLVLLLSWYKKQFQIHQGIFLHPST